jgi:[acyl-carrier-protein] S-malonyltransferase
MNLNDILQRQICNSVYFEDSIRYLLEQGVDTFIEIGPGKALSGFIKRIDRKVSIYNVSDYQGYLSLLEKFNA